MLFYNWGQGDKEGGQCAKDLLPWQSYAVSQWVHGFCRHNLEIDGRWIFYQMFSHLSWKPINAQPDLRGYKKEVINASRVKTTLSNGCISEKWLGVFV